MTTLRMVVDLEVEGDVEAMAGLFVDYLTSSDMPLEGDYSKAGWGGWDPVNMPEGPFITAVTVTTPNGNKFSTNENWGVRMSQTEEEIQQAFDEGEMFVAEHFVFVHIK